MFMKFLGWICISGWKSAEESFRGVSKKANIEAGLSLSHFERRP
jgi:hypothetical protein